MTDVTDESVTVSTVCSNSGENDNSPISGRSRYNGDSYTNYNDSTTSVVEDVSISQKNYTMESDNLSLHDNVENVERSLKNMSIESDTFMCDNVLHAQQSN